MSDKVIRASEVAEYLYCRRAWWLRRVAGARSRHVRRLQEGQAYHQAHNRQVHRAARGRKIAWMLLFVAVGVLSFWLVSAL